MTALHLPVCPDCHLPLVVPDEDVDSPAVGMVAMLCRGCGDLVAVPGRLIYD